MDQETSYLLFEWELITRHVDNWLEVYVWKIYVFKKNPSLHEQAINLPQ